MSQAATSFTKVIPDEVIDYLKLHHIITISTTTFTGFPYANTVAYSNDNRRLFFYVGEDTQMLRNIKDSRRVAFTIDDYTLDWRKVRELQGVGVCVPSTLEEEADAWGFQEKFGVGIHEQAAGIMHTLTPSEMHFVDYDYAVVSGAPTLVRSQLIHIDDAPPPPTQGPVSTDLDRLTYGPGEIVFRPGDSHGEYYVVVEGEVEIRGEGHGADQTVVRLGPGQFFGDQRALRGLRGGLTCHAVTRCALLVVDRRTVRDLLEPEGGN